MYLWIKALHVMAIIAWMAGMLYLVRLYVYHAEEPEAIVHQRFQVMERRLLNVITTPAMLVSALTGLTLLGMVPTWLYQPWMWVKLTLVAGMFGMHGMASLWRKRLIADPHFKPGKYFRVMNEVPTLLMIGIVLMIIVRPWGR